MVNTKASVKETDYLIIGAGAMGIAFADEIFNRKPNLKITILDRRAKAGGHWNDAYPFVRLHQPAAFYGVNSLVLGNGSSDLSSKPEILDYYEKIITKFLASGRVTFLSEHNYLGDGKVVDLKNPGTIISYTIHKKLVDATYMNVEIPATHVPKYKVDEGVSLLPLNSLTNEYDKWDTFYVIGNGKTGMDAVLFLIKKGVLVDNIHWICPSHAWLFNREALQVRKVTDLILAHGISISKAKKIDDVFVEMEALGNIIRLDTTAYPKKWRCATVSSEELITLKKVNNRIQKGRVKRITKNSIKLQEGEIPYSGKALFVDCSANALSKKEKIAIFSENKITLQSVFFCQQVFSAAFIARMELTGFSDKKKNRTAAVPHPELKEDWPSILSVSVENLLLAHRCFPLWMFRSRLNFMSYESLPKYMYYGVRAFLLSFKVKKAVKRFSV